MNSEVELETLATAAHGGMCALHALGLLWNIRKGNRRWAAFHLVAAFLSFKATRDHNAEAHLLGQNCAVKSIEDYPWFI